MESERGLGFVLYHQRDNSMLTREAVHRPNVRVKLLWALCFWAHESLRVDQDNFVEYSPSVLEY